METPVDPRPPSKRRSFFHYGAIGIALVAAFGLGYAVSTKVDDQYHDNNNNNNNEIRQNGGYAFINPLLECAAAEGSINKNLESFRTSIQALIKKEREDKDITLVSVYFRDLNNGPWFGIMEQEEFLPASLFKLPTSMSFYKLSESKPDILKKRLTLDSAFVFPNEAQTVPPSQEIEEGKDYSIDELIDRALIFSDNQAAALLHSRALEMLKQNGDLDHPVQGLQSDLNILESVLGKNTNVITTKNYSTLFRVLFNASFLNRALSEKLLRILSLAEYKDGLVAGVPPGVPVAHKFGEAGVLGGERQLHDCGIVYYPKRPYILCVMTRGTKPDMLPVTIRKISEEVYRHVDEQVKDGR